MLQGDETMASNLKPDINMLDQHRITLNELERQIGNLQQRISGEGKDGNSEFSFQKQHRRSILLGGMHFIERHAHHSERALSSLRGVHFVQSCALHSGGALPSLRDVNFI